MRQWFIVFLIKLLWYSFWGTIISTVQAVNFSPCRFKLGIKFSLILPGCRQFDTSIASSCCKLRSPPAAQIWNKWSVALSRQMYLLPVAELAESRGGSAAEATQPAVALSPVKSCSEESKTAAPPPVLWNQDLFFIHAKPLAADWSSYSVKMCLCPEQPCEPLWPLVEAHRLSNLCARLTQAEQHNCCFPERWEVSPVPSHPLLVVAQVSWMTELGPTHLLRASVPWGFLGVCNENWWADLWHVLQPRTHDEKLTPLSARENARNSRGVACLNKYKSEAAF